MSLAVQSAAALLFAATATSACTDKTSSNDDRPVATRRHHVAEEASVDTPQLSASTSTSPPPVASNRAIDGVGSVPSWRLEVTVKEGACTTPSSAQSTIKELSLGTSRSISEGSEQLDLLENKVTGGCRAAERDLALALNDGGFKHYAKKEYAVASRWWRAALTVKPSQIVSRYNLTCALALDGKADDALAELTEISRAAKTGDAAALNVLEKAKSDGDLASVRDTDAFKSAVAASTGDLVGPRIESETSALAVKLLPKDWIETPTPGDDTAPVKQSPKLLQIWTWRPEEGTELLVATVTGNPAYLHAVHGDLSPDYGGLVVLRRDDGKLTLLHAMKTGEEPPTGVAALAGGKVLVVSYTWGCGDLQSSLRWSKGKVVEKDQSCDGDRFVP